MQTQTATPKTAINSSLPVIDAEAACRLVHLMGRGEFAHAVGSEAIRVSGADQITAFAVDRQQVRCILAHRPKEDDLVMHLCRQYASNYFKRDVYLASCLQSSQEFTSYRVSLQQVDDAAYRDNLYLAGGLANKLSMVFKASNRTIYLNFYYKPEFKSRTVATSPTILDLSAYGRFFAECLSKHDLMSGGLFRDRTAKQRVEELLKERFPALSQREREVCARIATGHGAEAIARDLVLSEATVITFRRRAYAKLNISSQAELFAHCAGLVST